MASTSSFMTRWCAPVTAAAVRIRVRWALSSPWVRTVWTMNRRSVSSCFFFPCLFYIVSSGVRTIWFSGWQRRSVDVGKNWSMVPHRHRLCRLLLRATRSTGDLSSRGQDRRLDYLRHKLVARPRPRDSYSQEATLLRILNREFCMTQSSGMISCRRIISEI